MKRVWFPSNLNDKGDRNILETKRLTLKILDFKNRGETLLILRYGLETRPVDEIKNKFI
jgi:hypothetical protein